jgi:hypothetical protein
MHTSVRALQYSPSFYEDSGSLFTCEYMRNASALRSLRVSLNLAVIKFITLLDPLAFTKDVLILLIDKTSEIFNDSLSTRIIITYE